MIKIQNKKGREKILLRGFAKKRSLFKDKQGGDKMLSIYWFAILFIVAAAVVYMVVLFYGRPYDVRSVEADFLLNKVSDCLSGTTNLRQEIFSEEFQDNFLELCNLNFAVEDDYSWEDDQIFLEVVVSGFETAESVFRISEGNINLKDTCSEELNKNPYCKSMKFYSLGGDDRKYIVEIFVSIRKSEKNV